MNNKTKKSLQFCKDFNFNVVPLGLEPRTL